MADNKSDKNTKNGNQPRAKPTPQRKVVQLKSNQAGHHAGETFTEGRAKELGILDHCAPFKK